MIGGRELDQHIAAYCNSEGCDFLFDRIDYCDQNRIDRMQAFNKSAKERFLYKNKDLEYQREYRLVFAHEIPEDHFIRIGALSNTKILESQQLKDMCFSITYKSHKKQNRINKITQESDTW